MTVYLLYGLHPKKARFGVSFQNPMNNNRVLCGFHPHLGCGGVNPCDVSVVSVCGNPAFACANIKQGVYRD